MNLSRFSTRRRTAFALIGALLTALSMSQVMAQDAPKVKFSTTAGDFVVELYPDKAHKTVENFLQSVKDKHYDGTIFPRVIDNFMVQGGDPTGTGRSGPGYRVEDEFKNNPLKHETGVWSMANAGPGTNGSQFFIVYDDSPLPPNYSVWAKVTSGLDKVKKVAANGTVDGTPDGAPKTPVTINTITVK